MVHTLISLLASLQRFDDRRPSVPGEHWLAFGAGAALLLSASRRSSGLGRSLTAAAGGALIYRAASGRDGLAGLLRGHAGGAASQTTDVPVG